MGVAMGLLLELVLAAFSAIMGSFLLGFLRYDLPLRRHFVG